MEYNTPRYSKRNVAFKADIEIQKDVSDETWVILKIESRDDKPLTGNQIVEAVAEAVLLHWDNCPIEPRDEMEFDA